MSHAKSREFLLDCLRLAEIDEEIIKDVASACELKNVTALDIAAGKLSAERAANELFLTEQEAATVFVACQEMCVRAGALPSSALPGADTGGVVTADGTCQVISDADVVVKTVVRGSAPAESYAPPLQLHDCGAPILERVESPVAKTTAALHTRALRKSQSAKPAPTRSVKSPCVVSVKSAARNKMKSHYLEDVELHVKDDTPSYLRPTKSSVIKTQAVNVAAAPQQENKGKGGGFFSKLGSTFLQPTAAFLARVTGRKTNDVSVDLSTSVRLSQILKSPQGQRVTKSEPFHLRTSHAKSYVSMSTDDMVMMKALEEAKSIKPNKVPAFVKVSRPLQKRVVSTPKSPADICKPFRLESEQRHKDYQQHLKNKIMEEQKQKDQERRFHALDWNKQQTKRPDVPKKIQRAVTVPQEFSLKSAERAEYYEKVLSPVKNAKEEAAKTAEQKEQEEREAELNNMSITEYRKLLDFKARKMPDLSKPFKPDHSKAKPSTHAVGFALETDKRLGPIIPRMDADLELATTFYYCGTQKATPFMASLRGSAPSAKVHRSVRCSIDSTLRSMQHGSRGFRESRDSMSGRF